MKGAAAARSVWVDLEPFRRGLFAGEGGFAAPDWLREGGADPQAFWRSLGPALLAAPAGSSRSTLFERYMLAHEMGARHARGQAPAFVSYDDAGGFRATSYARVVQSARALAGAWRMRGLEQGMSAALIAPFSPELLAALLAAWHVGAVPALIPVRGRAYLRDRIEALAPDFVATSKGRALWLEIDPELRLPTAATGAEPDPGMPYAYAAEEPALRVFSPLGDASLRPFDVAAERLYLGALRDGALFFGLGAELGAAAPGFCEAHVVPSVLLACLATGAHYVAIGIDEARRVPERLVDGTIHLLGVDPRLRDAMLAAEPGGSGPVRWFRSPAAAHEPEAWSRLAASRPFARARAACYFPSPVAGGAMTWSAWRRSPELNLAFPAPGVAWELTDPGRGGAPTGDGTGVLGSADPAAPPEALGRPLLGAFGRRGVSLGASPEPAASAVGREALWVATLGAHRDGQRLPVEEIERLVSVRHATEVWACALVDDTRVGAVLVVFARPDRIGPELPARDRLARAIEETIASELAPELVPGRTEVFTLAPRAGEGGALDRDWCRGQHVSGRLLGKQAEPVFTAIARLRLAIEEQAGAPER